MNYYHIFIGVIGYLIYFKILKSIRIETLFNQFLNNPFIGFNSLELLHLYDLASLKLN